MAVDILNFDGNVSGVRKNSQIRHGTLGGVPYYPTTKKEIILIHDGERMSTEIPIWVNGKIRWLSGLNKKTTCQDVVEVLLEGEGLSKSDAKDYTIMERWRKVERQLDDNSKILKIWTHWGNEKREVRLCLRRIDNEVDSGRGSPIGSGYIPSLRRKRNRFRGNEKPPWAYKETLHPRRLAELDRFTKRENDYAYVQTKQGEAVNDRESQNDSSGHDNKTYDHKDIFNKTQDNDNLNNKSASVHKSYHCSGTGRLHSTPFSNPLESYSRRPKCCSKRDSKQKIRNSENIEKLMKLILAQGATIQSQLQKLKEREEQIELLEQERHLERVEKNGRNYLLETYLGSLKDAEIPDNDTEGEIETTTKKTNRAKFVEADTSLGRNSKKHGKRHREEENPTLPFKGLHKGTRSKSESRSPERKLEGNLKRTLSDNALAETSSTETTGGYGNGVTSQIVTQNAKDEYEDVVELRRIQSQIEMWEKVFRINKKLEKEEENLVRLHIKIKKIQSENYRIAKEKTENNEKENNEAAVSPIFNENPHPENNDTEKVQYEKDCKELEKNLETLRSDLEHNSKEIYKNFTRLMEKEDKVTQKRSCLSKIITDLERTNHEHDMLNEMIAMRENPNFKHSNILSCEPTTNSGKINNSEGLSQMRQAYFKESEYPKAADPMAPNVTKPQVNVNQRAEVKKDQEKEDQENLPSLKPKIVKISFEEKVENYESSEGSQEKVLCKDPVQVPAGALKSILKNRRNGFNKRICNLKTDFQKCTNSEQNNAKVFPPKNSDMNSPYIENYCNNSTVVADRLNSSYPYTVAYPLYVNFPSEHSQVLNEQLSTLSENIKNVCLLKNSHSTEINRTQFPHNTIVNPSTIVTTKALVHNDTDSSTSSDTSGLSSMYSSSTTVEEPYVEKNYVLDTLV